jgi:hypothetical protein
MGNEIILTRGVRAREIVAVRDITQLVGWTEVPERRDWCCLCQSCVPDGTPELMRRVRSAFERHVLGARRAITSQQVAAELSSLGMPLERARGRIAPDRLLPFARSKDERVRRVATSLLGHFRWVDVESALVARLADEFGSVREAAVASMVSACGLRRTCGHVLKASDDLVTLRLIEHLKFASDTDTAGRLLCEIAGARSGPVHRAAAAAATTVLADEDLSPATRARLTKIASRDA